MFVPISTICNFKMMKSLTEDAELIKSVMKETKSVVLNPEGTHVRPNFTNQRNTIILREIPSTTPVEDVKSLFARNAGLVQPHTVRSDIGDHWFVQFDKDADCSAAFTFLRSQTFLDKPIQARIKSENLLRGLISSPADIGSLPFQSRWASPSETCVAYEMPIDGLNSRPSVCLRDQVQPGISRSAEWRILRHGLHEPARPGAEASPIECPLIQAQKRIPLCKKTGWLW